MPEEVALAVPRVVRMTQHHEYRRREQNPNYDPEDWREVEKKSLELLESSTRHPKEEQERFLKYILEKNGDTEYLRKHGMNRATDVESFRKCLPVVTYEAYRESIERIAAGDNSPILSADPAVEVLVSSGTSGGDPKLYPVTAEDLHYRHIVWTMTHPVLSRSFPSLAKGKVLYLAFVRAGSETPGGLPTKTAVTSFVQSSAYRLRPAHPSFNSTSPPEVAESVDTEGAIYCHLLCGLLQRDEVTRIGAAYAVMVVKTFRALEKWYPELCDDIERGMPSSTKVKDAAVRSAVMRILLAKGAEWRKELAASVRKECTSEDGVFIREGIVRRLWPNCEAIDIGSTGTSKAYLPSVSHYSGNMQLVCTPLYACTEGFFGLNTDPSAAPEKTYYTLIPSVAYYEFLPIGPSPSSANDNQDQKDKVFHQTDRGICDLASVKIGQQYQLVVSTVSGFYRFCIDDTLEVVGFYYKTPIFEYICRMNTVLSVGHDKTDELELQEAVHKCSQYLERAVPGLRLLDYTSTSITNAGELGSCTPGHYVIFWELSSSLAPSYIPSPVLEECCAILESSFNFIYREGRYENIIGPLELRLLKPGTFDLMYEHAVSRGASFNQYKCPRGLGSKHQGLLKIVNSRVVQSHVSQTKPSFTPSTYKGCYNTILEGEESP